MSVLDDSCPICYSEYGPQEDGTFLCKDGINNSDYESTCKHYICVECCDKMCRKAVYDRDEVQCPICRYDWTQWIIYRYKDDSYYNDDDEDEDEDEDEATPPSHTIE